MVIKSGESGDTGSIFSNLVAWATAGLGIDVPCSLKLLVNYCHRKLGAFAQGENNNSINELPDDILGNIVSRLNFIEASRTSILSRRWNKIWTLNSLITFSCLHTLDIGKKYHDLVAERDKKRFFNAVDQCLQLYSGQKLKAFCVHCCFLDDHTCHLVRWIQIIARLDIQRLALGHSCSTSHGHPLTPAFTFSFKLIDKLSKLKTLELMFCYVETNFVSQGNSLVNLLLEGVPLRRQELSDILVSCPNLEILAITSCTLPRNLKITGPNLKLKILKLYDCSVVEKLEISELNLLVIKIKTCTNVGIMLSSVPKLQTLELVINGMDDYFVGVQGDLPLLKFLVIQTTFKILALPSTFRLFSNVRRLWLMTKCYPCYWKKTIGGVDLCNFASVLSACPLLEKLYLNVADYFPKEVRSVAVWPVLRHKHLEYMELSGFSYTQTELEYAKFILTSAEVLRLLVLRARTMRYDGEQFLLQLKEDVKPPSDAQGICANLQKHALSMLARVEILFD